MEDKIEAFGDLLEQWFPSKKLDCMKTFICECERRNCPGKTVSVNTYVRKIKKA